MKGSAADDKGRQTREPPYGSVEEANESGGNWGDRGHTGQTSAIQKHIAKGSINLSVSIARSVIEKQYSNKQNQKKRCVKIAHRDRASTRKCLVGRVPYTTTYDRCRSC